MTQHDLHSSHQPAYNSNFSTETALCGLMDKLLWYMERGENSMLVTLDISAVFETVDHIILCDVLKKIMVSAA